MLNNFFSKLISILGGSKDVKEEITLPSEPYTNIIDNSVEDVESEVTLGIELSENNEEQLKENEIEEQPEKPIIKKSKNKIKKNKQTKKASRSHKQGKINRAKQCFIKR